MWLIKYQGNLCYRETVYFCRTLCLPFNRQYTIRRDKNYD